jgi:hypothetical protein
MKKLQCSDVDSIRSSSSVNTITYQRPFRFQLNPSLTDIRCWRRSLSSDSASSSVTPGIGYHSGTAIKWVGKRILDAVTPIEIRRRLWTINRLIKALEKEPYDSLPNLALRKLKSIDRFAEDLLELSTYVFWHLMCTPD